MHGDNRLGRRFIISTKQDSISHNNKHDMKQRRKNRFHHTHSLNQRSQSLCCNISHARKLTIKIAIITGLILFILEELSNYYASKLKSIQLDPHFRSNYHGIPRQRINKKVKPQKTCRFISFDKKDNKTHHLPGYVDYNYENPNDLFHRHHSKIAFYNAKYRKKNSSRNKFNSERYNNSRYNAMRKEISPLQELIELKKQQHNLLKMNQHRNITLNEPKQHRHLLTIEETNTSAFSLTKVKLERVYFIHIGKAGGSTLACNLRVARQYTRSCRHLHYSGQTNESALSIHTVKRFHISKPNMTGASSFLISVRNPIERIKSWYLYEHPKNFAQTIQKTSHDPANTEMKCGQVMLYYCFGTLDELATTGLRRRKKPLASSNTNHTNNHNQILRISMNITQEECSVWAFGAVQGSIAASYHNYWNYKRMALPILSKRDSRNIYVIRTEHQAHDYTVVNSLFEEKLNITKTNVTLFDHYFDDPKARTYIKKRKQTMNSLESKRLKETNKTLSKEGLHNLCRALCEEIQIYKGLLKKAFNLNDHDRNISIQELYDSCPEEGMSLERRHCS